MYVTTQLKFTNLSQLRITKLHNHITLQCTPQVNNLLSLSQLTTQTLTELGVDLIRFLEFFPFSPTPPLTSHFLVEHTRPNPIGRYMNKQQMYVLTYLGIYLGRAIYIPLSQSNQIESKNKSFVKRLSSLLFENQKYQY